MSGALAINTIITHTPQVEAEVPEVPEVIMRGAGERARCSRIRNGHSRSEHSLKPSNTQVELVYLCICCNSESRPGTEGCLGNSPAKKRETPAQNYKKLDQKLIRPHLKSLAVLMTETLLQGWCEGKLRLETD